MKFIQKFRPFHFFSGLLIIFFSGCVITSNKTNSNSVKLYAIKPSYFDTLKKFEEKLNSGNFEYIYYNSKVGNCFGSSLNVYAKYIWIENEQCFIRLFQKQAKDIDYKDKIKKTNCQNLFEEFKKKRIDTVSTIPTGRMYMDPATKVLFKVKTNNMIYEREFEEIPFFNNWDSTHPLYLYVNKVLAAK